MLSPLSSRPNCCDAESGIAVKTNSGGRNRNSTRSRPANPAMRSELPLLPIGDGLSELYSLAENKVVKLNLDAL